MTDPSAYKMSKFVWSSGDCGAAVACDDISIMDGSFTCGGLAAILGDLCNTDYGASGAPCACMCEATVSNPLHEEATISNPLPEEKSVGKDICAGKSCSECLDGTDYACSFYDGKCILSESMKDPAAYKASKFVWMSEDCTDEGSYEKEDICAGKGCGECLDDTDYACGFYDGKCIPVESMMDPSAYKMSKFVWSSGDCGAAVACDDISIMDGSFTCGGLAAILGDLCNTDYGAPGAPCACTCESSVGNSQCSLINDDNKSYKCNTYYKKIVKCDICQDDNAGAVDNSNINDAIRKREKKAECATASDCESPYTDCWKGTCISEDQVSNPMPEE